VTLFKQSLQQGFVGLALLPPEDLQVAEEEPKLGPGILGYPVVLCQEQSNFRYLLAGIVVITLGFLRSPKPTIFLGFD